MSSNIKSEFLPGTPIKYLPPKYNLNLIKPLNQLINYGKYGGVEKQSKWHHEKVNS